MANGIKIKLTGIKGIQAKAKALQDTIFARPMMGDIGMFAMRAIKKRTLIGEDVNGLDFKPYNPMYAKERAKAGYSKKPVDLTRSGSMLSAMTADYDRNSVDIFFMNTSDPDPDNDTRNPAKAYFLHQDREFFALSLSDLKGIMQIVKKYYSKLMASKI